MTSVWLTGPNWRERVAHAGLVHDRDGHEVGLQGAGAVEVVVDFLDGVGGRVAVAEVERADGALDLVGHGHAGGDGRGILELRIRRHSNRRLPKGSSGRKQNHCNQRCA